MTVQELNRDQLSELKNNYFWGARDYLSDFPDDPDAIKRDENVDKYGYPDAIPDAVIYEFYAGIDFVNDDFWCSANIEREGN